MNEGEARAAQHLQTIVKHTRDVYLIQNNDIQSSQGLPHCASASEVVVNANLENTANEEAAAKDNEIEVTFKPISNVNQNIEY